MCPRRCRWLAVAGSTLVALSWGAVATAAPPGGRAYELVSPADKYYGVGVGGGTKLENPRASASGDAIYFPSNQALPSDKDGLIHLDSRADRTASGWLVAPLLPGTESQSVSGFADGFFQRLGVSDDGQTILYAASRSLDPADQDEAFPAFKLTDLYLRRPDGSFEWVTRGTVNSNSTDFSASISWGVLSADGSHVIFESAVPLLPADEARTGGVGLYDWHGGQLDLVGVDDAGVPLSPNGAVLGHGANTPPQQIGLNAVSRDGRRIFFTVDNRAYVRIDGAHTASLAPGSSPSGFQYFEGATPDGSQAFFVTDEALTADDTDSGFDVYRYTVSDGSLERVSKGSSQADVNESGVRVSDDGRRVYFTGSGRLTADAPADAERKLYLNDDGDLVYVGKTNELVKTPPDCDSGWRTTPDGEHLIFATRTALTPDDTDANVDLYEFSAEAGTLVRVSGDGTEGNGAVDARMGDFQGGVGAAGTCNVTLSTYTESRVMTDDGRFVFFDTDEGLVPEDTNGVMDVYQHDLQSGETSLLSGGKGEAESIYLDSGVSGRDVFFATFDALVPQDKDSFLDVYDARIGGGFPVPDSPAGCEDDCQGPSSGGVPERVSPGSGTVIAPTPSPLAHAAKKPALSFGRISLAQRRRAAKTGRLKVQVRSSVAGKVSLRLQMRSKHHVLNAGMRVVKLAPGELRTATIVLSARARRRLEHQRHLSLTVRAVLMPGHVIRHVHVRLTASPRVGVRSARNR